MARQKPHIRPRSAFKELINYLHSNVIDFEQLEEEGMMETYYKAMEFVGKVAGNSDYSPFYNEDGKLMLAIEQNTMNLSELSDITGNSTESLISRMNKLVNYGYVSTFKEKKYTYYKLTPYGRKFLESLINDPKSVLYDGA